MADVVEVRMLCEGVSMTKAVQAVDILPFRYE
jgi:hypothetical protein